MAKNNGTNGACMSFMAFVMVWAALVIGLSLVPMGLAKQTEFPSSSLVSARKQNSPPKKSNYHSSSGREAPSRLQAPFRVDFRESRSFFPPIEVDPPRRRLPPPVRRPPPPAPSAQAPPSPIPPAEAPPAPRTPPPPAPRAPAPRAPVPPVTSQSPPLLPPPRCVHPRRPPPHCIGDPLHDHRNHHCYDEPIIDHNLQGKT